MSQLPLRPSLESLRKQAKSLLRRFRENDAEALAQVRGHHPKPEQFETLRDAQLTVACEYGYPGWAELCAAVEAALDAARSAGELADLFADLACLCYSREESIQRPKRAAAILAERPEIVGCEVFAAAAACDVAAVRDHLDRDPAGANRCGGPREWPPLMYLAYSRVAETPPQRDAVLAAALLLERGADPRFYEPGEKRRGGWRWTALTGVLGGGEAGIVNQPPHPRERPLAELLLDAGADPNDSQALYNRHFQPENDWLQLLLERGLTADAPVDPDDLSQEASLDFLLAQAVRAGYVERVRLLLENGANARGRDTRYTKRTYVENAVLGGHGDVLALLVEHGAPRPELSRVDRFRMAVVAGEEGEASHLVSEDPALPRQPDLLVALAQQRRTEAVRLLLDLGADPNAMSTHGRGALHEAAWSGDQEMIELLLDRGARLDVRSLAHGGTAVGYAHYAGRFELTDWLLDRSTDVFDLAEHERARRLAKVLQDPKAAATARENGEKLAAIAQKNGDRATLAALREFGVGS